MSDLDELAAECEVVDQTLADVLDRASDLTPFAWRFRYPGDDEPPAVEDVIEAIALAKKVVEEIRERLPPSLL